MPTIEFYNNEENAKTGKCINCGNTNILVWPVNYYKENEADFAIQLYCKKCWVKYTQSCEICDEVFAFDHLYNINHTKYCGSCMRERFVRCYSCHTFIHKSENNYIITPDRIQRESLNSDYNWVICNDCYHNGRWLIHDYSFEPPFTFYKTEKDKKTNLYYGIELEVEAPQNKTDIILRLPDFIYVKADCSIENGFELVTHPATYNWLKENKNVWDSILTNILNDCYSFNTPTCDIHIHLSKNAFNRFHLYKFMNFIYRNPKFSNTIGQKTRTNSNPSRFKQMFKEDNKQLIRKAKELTNYHEDRYVGINLARKDTIEIRIFKGTLNPKLFWKNIEFVEALYNFSLLTSFKEMKVKLFKEFVKCKYKEYPNLSAFLYGEKVCKQL